MIRNYDFVDFPKKIIQKRYKGKERFGKLNGILRLKCTTVDNLHLGSGFTRYTEGEGMISEQLAENGTLIIPGSSVKGAVRHVARAISDSCIPQEKYKNRAKQTERLHLYKDKDKDKDQTITCRVDELCTVCNLFGMMGLASKVQFSDFTADAANQTEVISLPVQYSPHLDADHYFNDDDKHKGYKFYNTECEAKKYSFGPPKKIPVEVVKKKVVFTGDIRFVGLYPEELELLCQSLGLEKTFSHKLGGYRSEGLGTVNFECTGFRLNGEELSPDEAINYACDYEEANHCSQDSYERIGILCEIMPYRK